MKNKTYNKQPQSRNDLIHSIVDDSISDLTEYSRTILSCVDEDEGGIDQAKLIKHSALYSLVQHATDYESILAIFSNYFKDLYAQVSHYVRREQYEKAKMVKDATDLEVQFIIGFVIHNFPTCKTDITTMKKAYNQYYLA